MKSRRSFWWYISRLYVFTVFNWHSYVMGLHVLSPWKPNDIGFVGECWRTDCVFLTSAVTQLYVEAWSFLGLSMISSSLAASIGFKRLSSTFLNLKKKKKKRKVVLLIVSSKWNYFTEFPLNRVGVKKRLCFPFLFIGWDGMMTRRAWCWVKKACQNCL